MSIIISLVFTIFILRPDRKPNDRNFSQMPHPPCHPDRQPSDRRDVRLSGGIPIICPLPARSENEDGQYEHYRFDQMSDFLLARTDDDFSVKWEIHPCYRQALDIKKLNQSHRERFVRMRRGEEP